MYMIIGILILIVIITGIARIIIITHIVTIDPVIITIAILVRTVLIDHWM